MIFELCKYPETLGVAFKIEKIGTFGIAHVVQPATRGRLLKPVAYCILSRVTKRWIANVVRQAGGLNDHAEIRRAAPLWHIIPEHFTYTHAERAADAADFQRVGKSRMNVVVA